MDNVARVYAGEWVFVAVDPPKVAQVFAACGAQDRTICEYTVPVSGRDITVRYAACHTHQRAETLD